MLSSMSNFIIRRPPSGEEKRLILEVIRKTGTMTLDEIWEATGINPNTIRGVVVRLTNEGLIERVGKGVYKRKASKKEEI